MNTPSLVCGVEAVKDDAYFKDIVNKIIETREYAKEELKAMGFEMTDSKANFLFVTHPHVKAKELFDALKAEDIFVRYFNKERLDDYLRITIGTREEMDALFAFLRAYLAGR